MFFITAFFRLLQLDSIDTEWSDEGIVFNIHI
jgi:hypothetical protein